MTRPPRPSRQESIAEHREQMVGLDPYFGQSRTLWIFVSAYKRQSNLPEDYPDRGLRFLTT